MARAAVARRVVRVRRVATLIARVRCGARGPEGRAGEVEDQQLCVLERHRVQLGGRVLGDGRHQGLAAGRRCFCRAWPCP
jgi:hypothetical protein